MTPYYFWKVMLPLYLVTALSFTVFDYDTDDLVERSALTSAYFLAAFAMLYVVGEALPKTHFLTRVDKLIVSTIGTISLSGLLSRIMYHIHLAQGTAVAQEWNLWIETSLGVAYTLSNVLVFGPPWLSMRRRIAQLEHAEQAALLPKTGAEMPDPSSLMQQEPRKQVLPLVPTGARYFSLQYLLESSQLQVEQDDEK
jgi:hypothetical protein